MTDWVMPHVSQRGATASDTWLDIAGNDKQKVSWYCRQYRRKRSSGVVNERMRVNKCRFDTVPKCQIKKGMEKEWNATRLMREIC
jgi:hypothetical protein